MKIINKKNMIGKLIKSEVFVNHVLFQSIYLNVYKSVSFTIPSFVSETTTENSIKTAPNATRNVIISPKTKKANIGANIDSVDISIDALVAVVSL